MTDEFIHPPAKASDLTPRQLAIAAMVARHCTDQQIAAELRIACSTVRVHITAIAYRIHADQSRVIRTQIADWWRTQTPRIDHDAPPFGPRPLRKTCKQNV